MTNSYAVKHCLLRLSRFESVVSMARAAPSNAGRKHKDDQSRDDICQHQYRRPPSQELNIPSRKDQSRVRRDYDGGGNVQACEIHAATVDPNDKKPGHPVSEPDNRVEYKDEDHDGEGQS